MPADKRAEWYVTALQAAGFRDARRNKLVASRMAKEFRRINAEWTPGAVVRLRMKYPASYHNYISWWFAAIMADEPPPNSTPVVSPDGNIAYVVALPEKAAPRKRPIRRRS